MGETLKTGAGHMPGLGDDELTDDATLLAKWEDEPDEVFALLWRRHWAAGVAYAKRCWRPDEAEDLVSEAYLRVFKALRAGNGPRDAFLPYLYVSIRNTATKWANQRRLAAVDTPAEDLEAIAAPETPEATAEDDIVNRAFYAMDKRERQVLWLREVEGQPPREIATELGLNARHISTILDRAHKSFRRLYVQAHIDTDDLADDSEHAWALGQAGAVLTGQAATRTMTRFDKHLAGCPACAAKVKRVTAASSPIAKLLAVPVAGVGLNVLLDSPAQAAEALAIAAPPNVPPTVTTDLGLAGAAAPKALPLKPAALGLCALAVAVALAALTSHDGGVGVIVSPPPKPSVTVTTAPPSPPPTVEPAQEPSLPPVVMTPVPSRSSSPVPPGVTPSTAPAAPASSAQLLTVTTNDSGPDNVCYPMLAGAGRPGAALDVYGLPATVDADGNWQVAALTTMTPGSRLVVVTDSAAGERVAVTVKLAAPPVLSFTPVGGSLNLIVQGLPGQTVAVVVDGQAVGSLELDAAGQARASFPVTPGGAHSATARYETPTCHGPSVTARTGG